MREDILRDLQREIYDRCQKESNKFGIGCYYHIVAVVKNAEILAGKYGADKEVVMIAAWLHDIASASATHNSSRVPFVKFMPPAR